MSQHHKERGFYILLQSKSKNVILSEHVTVEP